MVAKTIKAIYRPTMDSDTIFELVDTLEQVKRSAGLSNNLRKFLSKLDSLAYDIGKGNRNPAYVATGARPTAISSLTTDDLGAYNEQNTLSANVATNLFSPSVQPNAIGMPAELDADSEAQLLALEAAMLAEVAGNGAGSENVLPERRKAPRTLEPMPTITTDDL